mmetsp:Transcript_57813/g.141212  ORF Transcript_57813/g.141212 Transcript_57813/m.141212 type:complete len:170 (-) Transcript_57813:90-599(-)|eukprot:CAMPEP_0113500390 /NCGR_PEP_ID=MMETSP0014_2-20120614/32298_1 /TAXON_ID=2857 /ORGANISM="Nitzschia sp." /LENGTH=169 /DNA_ID=CAMNT_0000394713 /DNA_START=608 /DNA_END=1117 /DNA_ORIENTATION=+ /assembly_acc=CAM_ASM_000159
MKATIDPSIVSLLMMTPAAPTPTRTITPATSANKTNSLKLLQVKTVLFIHSVFRYLDAAEPDLIQPIKRVIKYTIQRNRNSMDPQYRPLSRTIIVQVRNVLGETHWEGARSFFKVYVTERKYLHDQQKQKQKQKQQQQQQQYYQQLELQQRRNSLILFQQLSSSLQHQN